MAEEYKTNYTTTTETDIIKIAGLEVPDAGIIKSGESATYTIRGCVLVKETSTGKYRLYAAPTAKTDEAGTPTPATNGAVTDFYIVIGTAGSIEPGSITNIKYTTGAAVKTISGPDVDGIITDADGNATVNYDTGTIQLHCITGAPDNASNITITYKHYAAGMWNPIAILAEACDASAADTYRTIYTAGVFRAAKLTPDISSNTYAMTQLRKNGIYAEAQ